MAMAVQERTIPSENTLVKYDNPLLVTKHPDKIVKDKTPVKIGGSGKIQTSAVTFDTKRETIEILNGILPPKRMGRRGKNMETKSF